MRIKHIGQQVVYKSFRRGYGRPNYNTRGIVKGVVRIPSGVYSKRAKIMCAIEFDEVFLWSR